MKITELLNEMYIAYVLDNKSRKLLQQQFPPEYPDFIGHHVTWKFGVSADTPLPSTANIKVVGHARDDSLEALVVSVNGKTQRPDGSLYHITWSLDKSKGRKPVQSNGLVQRGYTSIEPIPISTSVELLK